MKSVESFKELLKEVLIKNDGDLKLHEHPDILVYAKELGLDERKLSKLLQEVDSTINWDYIKQQKELLDKEPVAKQQKRKQKIRKTISPVKKETPSSSIKPQQTVNLKKSKVITPGRLLTAGAIVFVIFIMIKASNTHPASNNRDTDENTLYTFADKLALRSSPNTSDNSNIVEILPYGTPLTVGTKEYEWSEVTFNNTKGYVASQFLLSKKEFFELEGIFGNNDAKEVIYNSRCRKALLDYFNTSGIMGNLSPGMQIEIYGGLQTKEVWQVFTQPKQSKYNTVVYTQVTNPWSEIEDFACIIKNTTTGERRFLLFSFDERDIATLEYESNAPQNGFIKYIQKTHSAYYVSYTNNF